MSSFQELLALRQKKLAGKYSSPVSMALADTPEGGAQGRNAQDFSM